MAKTNNTFTYVTEKELGSLGKATVELGHYLMNGEQKTSKVYLVQRYSKRDGSKGVSASELCKIEEAKELANLLGKVGK